MQRFPRLDVVNGGRKDVLHAWVVGLTVELPQLPIEFGGISASKVAGRVNSEPFEVLGGRRPDIWDRFELIG